MSDLRQPALTLRRRFVRSPALMMAALCGACGADPAPSTQPGGGIDLVDAAGRAHHLDAPARRIVSLVPSATLTIGAIGAEDLLVGRTDFDTAPWAMGLPSVGGGIQPSYETLVSLEPDLVVRFAGEQDPETPGVLDRMGIRHLAIRPDRIDDIRTAITLLGRVTGRDAEARALVTSIDEALDDVRRGSAGMEPVRVAYVLGGTPPWVAGPGTYVQEVIEIAGGTNVFGDLPRLYASVSPEELAVREIDVILTPTASSVPDWLARRAAVREVGDLLELPGPGVAAAAQEVARILLEERGS